MSFNGTWAIMISTPIGKQEVILQIDNAEGDVTGTAMLGDETVSFVGTVVDGNTIRWSQKITKPMSMTVKFDLKRDGDALSGTAKPGILPATAVTGHRVSA